MCTNTAIIDFVIKPQKQNVNIKKRDSEAG